MHRIKAEKHKSNEIRNIWKLGFLMHFIFCSNTFLCFCPMFSNKSFIILALKFVFDPFYFYILCKIRIQHCSFVCGYPVFLALLLKRRYFLLWMVLLIPVENQLTIYVRISFWALYFIGLNVRFYDTILLLFDYYNFVVSCYKFWNHKVWVLQLCFSFSRLFLYLQTL